MYARVTLVKSDPAQLEAAIANFKEQVVPASRKAPGYAGSFLLINRESGEGAGGTYWDSLDAMNAAEDIGLEARRQSIKSLGTEVLDVDRFEIFLADRKGEPVAPMFARQTQIYANTEKINEAIEFVRTSVQANVAAQIGYRSLIGGVNRMTGRVFVTSNWESAEARIASGDAVSGQRKEAAQIAGASTARVDEWEVAFVEVTQSAGGVDLRGVGDQARSHEETAKPGIGV
jgi:heme-degrading monooxygenase HmoA